MKRIALNLLTLSALLIAGAASAEKVVFTYAPFEGENVTSVSLRGDMNQWGETPLEMQPDGTWTLTVDLAPGEYNYKFFVNGQWPKDMEMDHDGDPLDPEAGGYVDDNHGGQNAVRTVGGSGGVKEKREWKPAPSLETGKGRIHYHRPDGKYSGWGLHLWEDTPEKVEWNSPFQPAGEDEYGIYWDFRLNDGAATIGFIVHKGDSKDPGPDQFLPLAGGNREFWIVSGSETIHESPPDVAGLAFGDLSRSRAHWVSGSTVLWKGSGKKDHVYRLHYAADGGMTLAADGVEGGESIVLRPSPDGVDETIRARFPHLGRRGALLIAPDDQAGIPAILKGQIALSATGPDGKIRDATGVQIPGVLDDLFYHDGPLGVRWNEGTPVLSVWAPTARSVRLHLYASSSDADAESVHPMSQNGGVWSVRGAPEWKNLFCLYEVDVYTHATGSVERNMVTDPYSTSLSVNSTRSQIVDMDDPVLKPEGWDGLVKPEFGGTEEAVLYELHLRDFSIFDRTVPDGHRGTYLAFTGDGNGCSHLRSLAEAGLTHVHLLPVFDMATIDEEKANRSEPGDLSRFPADSEEQQKAVSAVSDRDGYNWGYDPYHFGVPEGSYATEPDGAARIVEFRSMVSALSRMGLRVVMDVVYNHTHASGRSEKAVFDRIVPGYYHRLNRDGKVETSTCCQNTATEHSMMERFLVDDLVHWATDYKIDGFRFDLMGHHMKRNMEKARDTLHGLTTERDGVDGSKIILYGEGWNFGEVADGKRGVNATQSNMAGTGIGTFNDRIRDAIRGGSAFGDPREQGFVTGLYHDPNGFQGSGPDEKGRLLDGADRIRIGLAGNLKSYRFVAHEGRMTSGGDYAAVGYAADPRETVNYASAHDNQTLFDKIANAAPADLGAAERARMQSLALAVVGLGQGIPFFHAGSELLRSKSLDRDSYNSGDWFNRLDFSYETNNFGVGLPPAEKNRDQWPVIGPILASDHIRPSKDEITWTADRFRDLLRIRASSPLFRLASADEIGRRVRFHNTGPNQVPGLIVMSIADDGGAGPVVDDSYRRIVVFFNATKKSVEFRDMTWKDAVFELHPVQADGGDVVVKGSSFGAGKGEFRVPGRTAAVFVERR